MNISFLTDSLGLTLWPQKPAWNQWSFFWWIQYDGS